MLASELTRLGWTQQDMQLFADPKALARAPRDRVCKMLQDWFSAHLAITDPAVQERLLFETLETGRCRADGPATRPRDNRPPKRYSAWTMLHINDLTFRHRRQADPRRRHRGYPRRPPGGPRRA